MDSLRQVRGSGNHLYSPISKFSAAACSGPLDKILSMLRVFEPHAQVGKIIECFAVVVEEDLTPRVAR